jgi:hypothetical protein
MTLEEAITRERLWDELRAMDYINVAQLPAESYEENLARRAKMRLRTDEIRAELDNLNAF